MAGVTNYPFRKLCRSYGAALYVSEMVLASSVLSNRPDARVSFGPDEHLRSAQLYSTDAGEAAAAAEILITHHAVTHLDLNFGCPAPKVLRKGGGAALASDERKLRVIVSAVVDIARRYEVPVTAKLRAGLSEAELTYERAGRVLEECGVAAVALHARTVEEGYERGAARRAWGRIGRLAHLLHVPVIGNGDVFTAEDAIAMVRKTGARGVMIGRGCLGRPWLFGDLRRGFDGESVGVCVPDFKEVRRVLMWHVTEAVRWAEGEKRRVVMAMRKWLGWYWQGYTGLPEGWLRRICGVESLEQLSHILWEFDGIGVGIDFGVVVGERGKVGKRR